MNLDDIFTYHPPFGDQPTRYQSLRAKGRELADLILLSTPESREQSLALTAVQQAVMWGASAIAVNEKQVVVPPVDAVTIIRVVAGGDLQRALDMAATDTSGKPIQIRLEPRATYTGTFIFRAKTHNFDIDIMPDWDHSTNVGEGLIDGARRDLPTLAPASLSAPVITATDPAASNYKLTALRIAPTGRDATQISLGSATATDPLATPTGWVFKQCQIHGDAVNGQKHGMVWNCRQATADRCDMRHHGYAGADAQCILGYNGPGPFTIIGNYLEGYGENVMFGGGTVRSLAMIPRDIVIKGNIFTKNKTLWDNLGAKWSVKNLLELKDAENVLIEGNLFENCWTNGQTGTAILFKAAANSEPAAWVRCRRVTFRNNVVRNAGGFLAINNSEGTGTTMGCDDITIENNVAYNLGGTVWTGNGHAFRLGGGPKSIKLLHNTTPDNAHAFLYTWNDPAIDKMANLQIVGNIARESSYGIFGSNSPGQGVLCLDAYAPGWVCTANVFEDNSSVGKYPVGNTKVPDSSLKTGINSRFEPIDPAILATVDSNGKVAGADVAAIRAIFSQHGISW